MIMSDQPSSQNQVKAERIRRGWTQSQLAERAGISRTAITAIEGGRLVPSVMAALAVAESLGCTVEQLFGRSAATATNEVWAWEPVTSSSRSWKAEVAGKVIRYPADSLPMLTPLYDDSASDGTRGPSSTETLVIACCDPAAGLLASQFAAATGMRMLVIPRSSRKGLEMLRDGCVHLAGLHLSTQEDPDRNARTAREILGDDYCLIRLTNWQEGIAVLPARKLRSAGVAAKAKWTWVGREPGSGARQCLDRLLQGRTVPARMARDHRGVSAAVQAGWADAGICVQLASVEAGLDFVPVQEEAYDICFPRSLADDRRIKAFIKVVRSATYRRILSDLPGYRTTETGQVQELN